MNYWWNMERSIPHCNALKNGNGLRRSGESQPARPTFTN